MFDNHPSKQNLIEDLFMNTFHVQKKKGIVRKTTDKLLAGGKLQFRKMKPVRMCVKPAVCLYESQYENEPTSHLIH